MYEVNIRQYTAEGTFAAFQTHLPRLQEMGVDPMGGTPEEFGKLIRAETARFGKAVKDSGAKAD